MAGSRLLVDRRAAPADYPSLSTTATPPGQVRAAADRMRQLAAEGAFARPADPAAVVYRLTAGGHQQTGVVVEVPVEDYRSGRVRRHEAVRPGRVREVADLLAQAEVEVVPVTLTFRGGERVTRLLAEVTRRAADSEMLCEDGVTQAAWVVEDPDLAARVHTELAGLEGLYIADGHHRFAVAEPYAAQHRREGERRASDFVLAALFPAEQMRLLGYHRGVLRPEGWVDADVLSALAAQPATEAVAEYGGEPPSPGPGTVSVHLDGRWYRLRLGDARAADPGGTAGAYRGDPRASLDVVVLDEGVLPALLDGEGAAQSPRVTPLPGTSDAAAVAAWCKEHDAVGFCLHPSGVEQIMSVSDAGLLMPPKSTWFDPKSRAGLFLRDLRC